MPKGQCAGPDQALTPAPPAARMSIAPPSASFVEAHEVAGAGTGPRIAQDRKSYAPR
jgi:hypothetical protein